MITRRPTFYNKFQCIGASCGDNCCIGWEIDIDDRSNAFYQTVEGTFGDRLRASIVTEEDTHFVLEQERCPFLDENNLCDIITTLGEKKLCDICREHPRFYEWFGELTEAGLGLCCEEAARLVFESDRPIAFEVVGDTHSKKEQIKNQPEMLTETEEACLEVLSEAREYLFAILQNRTCSIWKRLWMVLDSSEEIQECLDFDDFDCIRELISESRSAENETLKTRNGSTINQYRDIFAFYQNLEPIDEMWPIMLDRLSQNIEVLLRENATFLESMQNRVYEYEHLAVYLLYRYFLKAVFDRELLSRVKTIVINILIVKLLDIECWERTGEFSKKDRIQTVKSYSKEMEYCEENLEALVDASWSEDIFSVASLKELLL